MVIERVFPTENDVGGARKGRVYDEVNTATWRYPGVRTIHLTQAGVFQTSARSFVMEGLSPTDGGGLNLNIAAGKALIEGFYVNNDAVLTHALPDNATTHVYLQLTKVSSLVTAAAIVNGLADGSTVDAILLCRVVTAVGVISDLSDERRFPPGVICGTYVGNGSTTKRFVDLVQTPMLVIVSAESVAGTRIFAISHASVPRERDTSSPTQKVGFYAWEETVKQITQVFEALTASSSWTPGIVGADGGIVTVTITVTGAVVGDVVSAEHPGMNDVGLDLSARVTSADTVTARYLNVSSTTKTPTAGTLRVLVFDISAAKAVEGEKAFVDFSGDGKFTPEITKNGFNIAADVSETRNMNEAAVTYHYVAVM